MIRASGLVDFHKKANKDTALYEKALNHERKHIILSDALATIMVKEKQSDVIATSLLVAPDEVTLLWANNSGKPLDDKRSRHLQHLQDALGTDTGAKTEQLLRIVVDGCLDKIVARIGKFVKSVETGPGSSITKTSEYFTIDMNNNVHKAIYKKLQKRKLISESMTLSNGLDSFVERLRAINKSSSLESIVAAITRCKFLVDSDPSLGPRLEGPRFRATAYGHTMTQVAFGRLSKIADYRHACQVLETSFKVLTSKQSTNIQLRQVSNIVALCFEGRKLIEHNRYVLPLYQNHFAKFRLLVV